MLCPFNYRFACLLVALLASGCRLPGRDGPISESLVNCRQLSRRGIAALERGQQQEAEKLLAEAVAACPVDPEARRQYAEALWQRGASHQAIEQLEEAGRLVEEDATLRVRLAEMQFGIGQVRLARQTAERALDADPRSAAAWIARGRVMRAEGNVPQALADYHRALGYAPTNPEILLATAELYHELNRPQRMLETLHSLTDTYVPGEEPQRVLHLTGLAYLTLGRYQDAVASLSAAVRREQPTPEIYCRLGEAELLAGHPEAASAAARNALMLQPTHQPSRELVNRIEFAQRAHDRQMR